MKRICERKAEKEHKAMIDVKGIPAGMLFAALFGGAKDNGDPRLHKDFGQGMTEREGDAVLALIKDGFVGYYARRIISIQFFRGHINSRSYDKHNGKGKAAEIVAKLRAELDLEDKDRH